MRVAVATGVAGGIGGKLAGALSSAGYHVICVDLADGVHEVAGSLESGVAVQADLTSVEGRAKVVAAVKEAGELDLLVNNAGITRDARIMKIARFSSTPCWLSTLVPSFS